MRILDKMCFLAKNLCELIIATNRVKKINPKLIDLLLRWRPVGSSAVPTGDEQQMLKEQVTGQVCREDPCDELPEAGDCEQGVLSRRSPLWGHRALHRLMGPSAALAPSVCTASLGPTSFTSPFLYHRHRASQEVIQMCQPLALLAVPSQPC